MTNARADVIFKRTYSRPKESGTFESHEEMVDRVVQHQAWLWDRALGKPEAPHYHDINDELKELRELFIQRKASLAGRTNWLGGTRVAKNREASQFNCAFSRVQTIHDMVDAYWLLLQGCGFGFYPSIGTLNGFSQYIPEIKCVHKEGKRKSKGKEHNKETWNAETKTWTIKVGDSAEAWAKAFGKLLAGKYPANTLVLDYSEIRDAGFRLSGYGWLSVGYKPLHSALYNITKIMNRRSGQLLTEIDILDILNHMGTTLSTRRSSEIAVLDYNSPRWEEFARAKVDLEKTPHRQQSNNSLIFWNRPSRKELQNLFSIIQESGGSEPGFINGEHSRHRAPWFKGVNPCGEILLGDKSFCNLTEIDLAAFKNDRAGLERAIWLLARANYRQTCVNLDDGILQRTWHENNEFLRLCGVGTTGHALCPELSEHDYKTLNRIAVSGAYSMADELGLPRPKNVTTVKPSGTLSKYMNTTEGCHTPEGEYIINNIRFSNDDELLPVLKNANYRTFADPNSPDHTTIVSFPVAWEGVDVGFNDSAIAQLERYKMLMRTYVDHNCSITVSYTPDEIDEIIDWLLRNWDEFVAVSWKPRLDPTVKAEDLGFPYLPQEVITRDEYEEYVKTLAPVNLDEVTVHHTTDFDLDDNECDNGVCPVR